VPNPARFGLVDVLDPRLEHERGGVLGYKRGALKDMTDTREPVIEDGRVTSVETEPEPVPPMAPVPPVPPVPAPGGCLTRAADVGPGMMPQPSASGVGSERRVFARWDPGAGAGAHSPARDPAPVVCLGRTTRPESVARIYGGQRRITRRAISLD
jgi:hypothetical protein